MDGITGGDVHVVLKVVKGFVVEPKGWYNDLVAFEKAVGLVAWQKELVLVWLYPHSVTSRDLLPILEGGVVWEG